MPTRGYFGISKKIKPHAMVLEKNKKLKGGLTIQEYASYCERHPKKKSVPIRKIIGLIEKQGKGSYKLIKPLVVFIGQEWRNIFYSVTVAYKRTEPRDLEIKIKKFFKHEKIPRFSVSYNEAVKKLTADQSCQLQEILKGSYYENAPYCLDQLRSYNNRRPHNKEWKAELNDKPLPCINRDALFADLPEISGTAFELYGFFLKTEANRKKILNRDEDNIKKLHGPALKWTTKILRLLWTLPKRIDSENLEARIKKKNPNNDFSKHRMNLIKANFKNYIKNYR